MKIDFVSSLPDAAWEAVDAMADKQVETGTPDQHEGEKEASSVDVSTSQKSWTKTEFRKWVASLDEAKRQARSERFRSFLKALRSQQSACTSVEAAVKNAGDVLRLLSERKSEVVSRSSALHQLCSSLLKERARLESAGTALSSVLFYFEEFNVLQKHFTGPKGVRADVGEPAFFEYLSRAELCLFFLRSHTNYTDADAFARRFDQLIGRAMSLVKFFVLGALRTLARECARPSTAQQGGEEAGKEGLAAAEVRLYAKFRAASEGILKIAEELQQRANAIRPSSALASTPSPPLHLLKKEPHLFSAVASSHYSSTLLECRQEYERIRLQLVLPILEWEIQRISTENDLTELARKGCYIVINYCVQEYKLYSHFFRGGVDSSHSSLLGPLCDPLQECLRPRLFKEKALDKLFELCEVFVLEMLEGELERNGEAADAFRDVILRINGDVQERLIFRFEAFITQQIEGFTPSDEVVSVEGGDKTGKGEEGKEGGDEEGREGWYPPVRTALESLSRLYRCVDRRVFRGIASEVVRAAIAAIEKGAAYIATTKKIEAELFTIRNLLILREQISPFDVSFENRELSLDFADLQHAFAELLQNPRRLMEGVSSIWSLMRTSTPKLKEEKQDVKKELERRLRSVCESFIMSTTRIAVHDLLTFLGKAQSVPKEELAKKAWASEEKVKQLARSVEEVAIKESLPRLFQRLSLYLRRTANRSFIFKPIRANIVDAYARLKRIVDAAYSEEARLSIALLAVDEVERRIDSLIE
uniref:Conserved oligomeric Golgi complex subunit 3 n=1 Tax=Palpitomonas bilix TaxID=652834 RepID=A0A7S3G7S3_9EUKA|mmetsp:Transcript_28656/g.73189  ORF Transcript_28656/g.73189 Transcript_28656/m.73189 type:complete len:762 (+) Transcript_28656:182-2467(+)